jgi:sec-independent protein translocase protein TatC
MAEERDPFENTRMSLGQHLAELRKRLFRGVLAVFIAFCVGWGYYKPLGKFLLQPLVEVIQQVDQEQVKKYEDLLAADPTKVRTDYFLSPDPAKQDLRPEFTLEKRPVVTGVTEGFMYGMWVAIVFGLAVGGPILLWQMWRFISAGLYAREKRVVMAYFPASVFLFLCGVVFGFTLLLPYCMYFMAVAYPVEEIKALFSISEYKSFLTTMTLALGLIFQLPIVMYALVHVDIVQRSTFARFRPYFVLFAFVFGGVITPPDPLSQFMVAVPMIALYEVGLLVTLPMARRRARESKQ